GVIAAGLLLLIALSNQRMTVSEMKQANELFMSTNMTVASSLRNAEVAHAMGMMGALQSKWRTKQHELIELQRSASNIAGSFSATTKTLRLAVQSAAIGAGAYLALSQEISPGMVIAGSILIGRALQPVEMAVGAWKGFVDAKGQYNRLADVLERWPGDAERMQLPPIAGTLQLAGATIVPPGTNIPRVRNASFTCLPGTVTMILGPSGAGKSTLVRSVLGIWPTVAGDIRLDGADIFAYDRTRLGPQIGYLPQDIELFEGTVSSNIARLGEVDSASVIQAASDAGVHEFILSLPEGYDTPIGPENGVLSPGQRQRIALARALYCRPRLVVLDEPNSNLDQTGEVALNEAIGTLKSSGATVLVVSHRTAILPLVDQAIVLTDGLITDIGQATEVIGRIREGARPQRATEKKGKPIKTVVPRIT
ncbi:ATP-binding cassette domain-containing protein, partial [Luminiphilus sp.]|nr:ATP-binding cassette domain-containing protein [Luminiphilus sp.]